MLAAVGAVMSGCGVGDDEPLRTSTRQFMTAVADGAPETACGLLTRQGAAELESEFGSGTCVGALSEASRFVAGYPEGPVSYRAAKMLREPYIPAGPPPVNDTAGVGGVRVIFFDPVIGQRQAVDLRLRRSGGEWRVDEGTAALFTRLKSPVRRNLRSRSRRSLGKGGR
jgi:hypothetical protein